MNMTNHRHPLAKTHIKQLVSKEDPLILEVGCNAGQDTRGFLESFKELELHCFEPDPRPIAEFRQQFDDYRCFLHEIAIAEQDGQTTFFQSGGLPPKLPPGFEHMTEWHLSGSLRRPTGHLQHSPWCTFNNSCTVATRSLDSWAKEWLSAERQVDFIWADVQGAEGDLIRGGKETLKRTRYLYSEFYNRPFYDGQINLDEIFGLLGSAWELLGIYEGYNFLARNTANQP